jgi:hypothetical protein
MFSRAAIALLSLMLLAACALIDRHEKLAGWPELRLVEHYVPDEAMRARCAKYVPFGLFPEACAEFYFDRGECHVWYSREYPPQPYVKEHERLHCRGYAHVGDTSMREILARYQAARSASAEAARSAAAGGSATPDEETGPPHARGRPIPALPRSGKAAPG